MSGFDSASRHTTPKRGTEDQIISAALKSSTVIWPYVERRALHKNMRVATAAADDVDELGAFAELLLEVGDGAVPVVKAIGRNHIEVPAELCLPDGSDRGLIDHVYAELSTRFDEPEYFYERAILTPLNKDVKTLNERVTAAFPGEAVALLSADALADPDDGWGGNAVTTEFLNGCDLNGFPPHELELKKGMPVMLLRNVDPAGGHCNGTRYVVVAPPPAGAD